MRDARLYIRDLPDAIIHELIRRIGNSGNERARTFRRMLEAEQERRRNPAPLFNPSNSYNRPTVLDEEQATMPQPGNGLPAHLERTQTRPAASDDFQAIPAAHRPAESFPCGEY